MLSDLYSVSPEKPMAYAMRGVIDHQYDGDLDTLRDELEGLGL